MKIIPRLRRISFPDTTEIDLYSNINIKDITTFSQFERYLEMAISKNLAIMDITGMSYPVFNTLYSSTDRSRLAKTNVSKYKRFLEKRLDLPLWTIDRYNYDLADILMLAASKLEAEATKLQKNRF